MTRDDIIRMARQAGFAVRKFGDEGEVMEGDNYHIQTDKIERFAALVAAAEREACAKVCDEADKATHPADLADAIRARGQA